MFHVEHLLKYHKMEEKELHRGVVPFLNCKDYLVSHETYEIMLNKHNEMLVTSPIPADLDKYYDSEEYQSNRMFAYCSPIALLRLVRPLFDTLIQLPWFFRELVYFLIFCCRRTKELQIKRNIS